MKKALKYLGILLAIVVVFALSGFTYISFKGIPTYEVEKIEFQSVSTPQSIERGRKLASMLCASCHKNPKTGNLSGTKMMDAPAEFGEIYSLNITQDKEYGIGDWTDAELLYLLRTGIKRDGTYAPPYMAKLPSMADEDMNAIISFLRSDDPLVRADPRVDRHPEPSFLTKVLCNTVMKPFPMPTEPIPLPDSTNMVALGKYLAHNLDCFSCHSADFKTNDFLTPEQSPGYFGGGNKPLDKKGRVMLTPNLTPDKETGIGNWTETEFVNAVKSGLKKGEPALQYPMAPYVHLTDTEAKAIFQYLQTIPPIKNKIERSIYN
jgi:cytochrome c2